MDKEILALETDAYIDRILKLMQIIYYGTNAGEKELADKILKTYKPVIELLADKIDQTIIEYTKNHGEL